MQPLGISNMQGDDVLTLCWCSHQCHRKILHPLNNCTQPKLYALLISNILFLSIIICIQHCGLHSMSDQPVSTLSQEEMTWPLSYSGAFCGQFTSIWSSHWLLVNMGCPAHGSSCSSFSSISVTYYKQFQISQPGSQGLCGRFCWWTHGWMQQDAGHSDGFVLNTDSSGYDFYDITHFNFVRIFCQ